MVRRLLSPGSSAIGSMIYHPVELESPHEGSMYCPSLLALLCAVLLVSAVPRRTEAQSPPPADGPRWVLEIGPYVGYFDFDHRTHFEDFGLFGARTGVHLNSWLRVEGEFDEVYTEREISGNRARQITFALHARVEPFQNRLAPLLLAGVAFVALDDSDDPDAYSDGLDLGLGLRYRWSSRWILRGEWLLRRQPMRLLRPVTVQDDGDSQVFEGESVSLWARAFRVGMSYVF